MVIEVIFVLPTVFTTRSVSFEEEDDCKTEQEQKGKEKGDNARP